MYNLSRLPCHQEYFIGIHSLFVGLHLWLLCPSMFYYTWIKGGRPSIPYMYRLGVPTDLIIDYILHNSPDLTFVGHLSLTGTITVRMYQWPEIYIYFTQHIKPYTMNNKQVKLRVE